jgi:hypothetical protein
MGLFRRTKNNSKPLLRQIIDLIPPFILKQSIDKYKSDKYCSRYKTYDHLVSQMFGQLNKCLTLEDISTGIGVSETYIRDLGLQQSPARSTMGDGNKKRNWQVFGHLYHRLIAHYQRVLVAKHQGRIIEEIKHKVVRINDSTTISLCLNLFNWAKFRTAKGGIKIHTGWDDTLMLPTVINITPAALHDSKGFKQRIYEAGTIIVEDRGYYDFQLMKDRSAADNHFVTRMKDNAVFEIIKHREQPDDKEEHIICDQEIQFTGTQAVSTGINSYAFRKVVVYDEQKGRTIELITNNFEWSADTVSELYKRRWQIETFFKTLKQNLQVKTFTGTSENAVKAQIYIVLICYLLLELLRRNTCKESHAFSNFTEKIRICLSHYLSLDYVCNRIFQGAKTITLKPPGLFSPQNNSLSSNNNSLKLLFH